MIKFYFNGSPNPGKVALYLEEAELEYAPHPIDVAEGQQFTPDYLAINPNGKVPAIEDDGVRVFDSNAILLYLAEKTGKFLPTPAARGELLSWLMFVGTGLGPFTGQAFHFKLIAPDNIYGQTRYTFEARRHLSVLNTHLNGRSYIVGPNYSIVDMAMWGWARHADFILGPDALATEYPHLKRLIDEIDARPAAARAKALPERFPFTPPMGEKARANMYKHIVVKPA